MTTILPIPPVFGYRRPLRRVEADVRTHEGRQRPPYQFVAFRRVRPGCRHLLLSRLLSRLRGDALDRVLLAALLGLQVAPSPAWYVVLDVEGPCVAMVVLASLAMVVLASFAPRRPAMGQRRACQDLGRHAERWGSLPSLPLRTDEGRSRHWLSCFLVLRTALLRARGIALGHRCCVLGRRLTVAYCNQGTGPTL